jgi:Protein of unknown function (DUF3592)
MKKLIQGTFGVIVGSVFLAIAVAVLVWDVGMLRLAYISRGWPTTEGTVTYSHVESSGLRSWLDFNYTYQVEGVSHTSGQVSFDLGDGPGGGGSLEKIVERYPEGHRVTVYFDPARPQRAILEPGDYEPFVAPFGFVAIACLVGFLLLRESTRDIRDGRRRPRRKRRRATPARRNL